MKFSKAYTNFFKITIFLFPIFFIFTEKTNAQDNLNYPPKPFNLKEIRLPKYKSFTLNNGLNVYLIEDHKRPSVSFFLYLDYLPKIQADTAGLGTLTARLMKQGAGKRSREEIDEELDFMGSDLNVEDNLLYANSLTRYSESTLEILSDIVKSPKFLESEFLKSKEELISKIQSEKQNPELIAANIAKTLLYGQNHPYGEIATEKTLKQIKLKDCITYHSNYFKPNVSHLAIMGDIGLDEAKKISEKYFGDWEAKKIPEFKLTKQVKQAKTKIYLSDRPDSVQSTIKITSSISLRPGDKDIYSAVVMNTLLGGGIFRLYQNLRETHGYTYGVYSSIHPDKYIGNFSIDLNTKTSSTIPALKEIFYEIKRIRTQEVSDSELQLVKNYLTGQFSLSLESPGTIALFAIKAAIFKLPDDFYETYLQEIQKVTKADIKKAANKYIRPTNTKIIVVGLKKDLLGEFRKYKKYPLVKVDKYGENK